jgi:hypothetical protein
LRLNLHYLQAQWDAVLLDLQERDGERALKVRDVLAGAAYARQGYDPTGALRAARLSWHLLDPTARNQWLGAWNQVRPFRLLHTESTPAVMAPPGR